MARNGWMMLGGLLLISAAVDAADANGQFVVKGAGLLSCGEFITERDKRSESYQYIGGWVDGFVTAHNKYAPDTYDVTSFENTELLLAVMDNHCRANPQDRLYPVLNSIVDKLAPERLQQQSPGVQLADGRHTAVLYRETISRIQQRLRELDLYKSGVDGTFSDATRSALAAFQKDHDLQPTGFPDQTTLWRLLRN